MLYAEMCISVLFSEASNCLNNLIYFCRPFDLLQLSANAYGSVSLITSNWYGTYGGRIRIQGWIDWYMSDDYFHANLVAEGKACLGFCMSSQWDLFDKAYYF